MNAWTTALTASAESDRATEPLHHLTTTSPSNPLESRPMFDVVVTNLQKSMAFSLLYMDQPAAADTVRKISLCIACSLK